MRRVLFLAVLVAAPARADWEVRRAPGDPRVAEALLEALLRAPDDRAAVRRLVAQAGRGGLGRAAERCDARAAGVARIACGHLHREAGHADAALARYREAAAASPDDPRPRRASGELSLQLRRPDDALAELEAARARTPEAGRAAVDELLLPLYAQAKAPALAERQRAAAEVARELTTARPGDGAARRRAVEALAAVEAYAPAWTLLGPLVAQARDPWTRAPLLFRGSELAEAAHLDDDALAALEQAIAVVGPRDGRRHDALARIVAIERRRERLPMLAARWAALPEGRRDAALEEQLGRILDELGDPTARTHLARAIALDPRATGPRRLLMRLHTRAGDEDAAIAELRRLVALSGGEPRLALELAERLHARPGGTEEALALADGVGRRQRDAATHAALAALYQKWKAHDRALAEQQLLIRLEPDDPEHLIALGELYDQRGDRALANKSWRRLAPGADPPIAALLRLADVLAEHDQPGEALALLERAAHARPDDASIERRLADVLDRLHRDAEAEAIYRRLVDRAVATDDAALLREIGSRWMELASRRGALDRALGALTAAAERAQRPAEVELALLVARGRLRERRGTEAERVLRKAAGAPRPADRARVLEALADLLGARAGGAPEALELLVRAAGQDPTRAPHLYARASARAAELYRDEEALRWAVRAVELAPLDAEAHEHLGGLLEARDPARALTAYDRALELDPARDRLRLRAAELALRRGDDAGAAARYRALLLRARDEQAIEEAAHRAVVVHELAGRLGELEREVAPRAGSSDGRPALRRLLIEIDRRYVPLLATRAEAGDATAIAELARIAGHAVTPLLDGVIEGDRDERRAAIALLGQLGAHAGAALLLRVAAGEAARQGAEPAPADVRIAAAESAAWLATREDLPRIERLAGDPEQRVRVAAGTALARLAAEPRARARLALLVDDDHDRVAAVACLGLLEAAEPIAPATRARLAVRALDAAHPLGARACAAALAREADRDPRAASLPAGLLRDRAAGTAPATPLLAGHVRALLASGDPEPARAALAAALGDPALRQALLGGAAGRGPPRAGASVDLPAWLARAEAATPLRDGRALTAAVRALLRDGDAEPVLADLILPDGLLARLAGRDGAARAELIDAMVPELARLAGAAPDAGAARRLALSLLAERAAGLGALELALQHGDRRAALLALAEPRAAALDAEAAARLAPVVRAALAAAGWRERLAALASLDRQPTLGALLGPERLALAGDANPFVAEAARRNLRD